MEFNNGTIDFGTHQQGTSGLGPIDPKEKALYCILSVPGVVAGAIGLVGDSRSIVNISLGQRKDGGIKISSWKQSVHQGFGGWTLAEDKPLVIDEIREDFRLRNDFLHMAGISRGKLVCLPIYHTGYKDEASGWIYIYKKPTDTFSKTEMSYFGYLRDSLSLLIDIQERTAQLRRVKLQQMALNELQRLSCSSASLTTTLRLIGETVTSLAAIDTVAFLPEPGATGIVLPEIICGHRPSDSIRPALHDSYDEAYRPGQWHYRLLVRGELKGVMFASVKNGKMQPDQTDFLQGVGQLVTNLLEKLELESDRNNLLCHVTQNLLTVMECRNVVLANHCRRVAAFSKLMAEKLHLAGDRIEIAALLHDLGQVGWPDKRLKMWQNTDPLEKEKLCFTDHPTAGCHILQSNPCFEEIIPLIRHHHENFDGSGYPERLRGEAIPHGARIIRIADVFCRLTQSDDNRELQLQALAKMSKKKKTIFDPDLLEEFSQLVMESNPVFEDWSILISPAKELTPREMEILKLLAEGLTNQEISQKLFIEVTTVKSHVSSILRKLSLTDRTKAAVYAIRNKLV